MAAVENVFRIFISSTFSDMVAERTVLQERVFPRLREFCRARGGRFQAIDLRWGVSTEAARDRRTLRICLDEIARCCAISPALNFLVLLGDRYGWRPVPAEIDAADFERLCAAASRRDRARLRGAYRRDDNAARPCFLQMAQGGPESARVQRADAALRAAFRRVLTAAFGAGDPRQIVYGAAATHLEIAARLNAEDRGRRGVLCYFRRSTGKTAAKGQSDDDRDALASVKRQLVSLVGEKRVRHYRPLTKTSGPAADTFAERVEADLRAILSRELRRHARRPALDREVDEQQRFARDRARHVIGRTAVLVRVRRYLAGTSTEPFVLAGAVGSGKSSVVARAALDAAENHAAVVVSRFVGATPDTADIERMLRGICLELARAYGDEQLVPFEYHDLEKDFHRRLAAVPASRPLHLFVDALDQIDMHAAGPLLPWLPRQLPDAVKLVASVLDDRSSTGDVCRTIRGLLPPSAFLELRAMDGTDAGRVLDIWLDEAGRTLQPKQRAAVLRAYAECPLPLYLRIAFEQARQWRSFDRPFAFATAIGPLAQQFYERLESHGQHGSALLRHSLRYLLAARYGLAEDEMLAVLSSDVAVATELRNSSPHSPCVPFLPFVIWSRLRSDLAPYLSERAADDTPVVTFYHRALRSAAASLFADEERQAAHAQLASFFAGASSTPQPDRFATRPSGGAIGNRRKLSELPYQQTEARLWSALVDTLTNLSFVQAKSAAGLTGDLVGDYDRAGLAIASRTDAARDFDAAALADFRRFVQRERSSFEAYASVDGFVLQQAHNQSGNRLVADAWARARRGASSTARRWFRIDRALGDVDPLLATLERHQGGVTDCAFDSRGSLLVSSGMDHIVYAWRTSDWAFAETIVELAGSVDSCAVSGDGLRVATACADGYVRIHDRRTQTTTVCEGEYDPSPRRCRFISGDTQIVSVGRFGLKVHDAETGRLLHEGLSKSTINDCAPGPGTLVTAGDCDETLFVYDTAAGAEVASMHLDVRRVQGAVFSPDGRFVLGTGGTFTREDDTDAFGRTDLWDAATWEDVSNHGHRHAHPALNCAFIDQGQHYVVGLGDGTLEIYRTATGDRVNTLKGHDKGVRGLALSPNGTCLATAGFDGRLKIWRTAALISTAAPARAPGRGLFCAIAAGGSSGWIFTGNVDRFRCDFSLQRLPFAASPQPPASLPRSRPLAALTLQRQDPGSPMQACSVELHEVAMGAAHRTSPVVGAGDYWLVHDSARMFPSAFHLLPSLGEKRWSPHNRTWARSADGRGAAVVRTELARVAGGTIRHVSLLLFEGPGAGSPSRIYEWDLDLSRSLGQCSYSIDGGTLRLVVGSEIHVVNRRGRRAMRVLQPAASEIRGFCESPAGTAIVGACVDGQICWWDANTGQIQRTYAAHAGEAVDCAFIDDREFVSIGADGTLQLWTRDQSDRLAVLVGDTGFAAVAVSPAHRRVLALDAHGRPYFVDVVHDSRSSR